MTSDDFAFGSPFITQISFFSFAVGFILLFPKKTRKIGLIILIISVIALILGIGAFISNCSVGGMH